MSLRWRDINLDKALLQIRTTLKIVHNRPIIAETKTQKSRRRIALTPMACDALKRHLTHQRAERLKLGPAWNDNDLVFPNTIGKLYDGRNVDRLNFLPALEGAGLPRIRFHDLRHTAATLLLLQGVHAKVVSEMLGHASVAITLDRYSHVSPDMQRDAALAMQQVLGF